MAERKPAAPARRTVPPAAVPAMVIDAAQAGGSSRGGEENTAPHPGTEPAGFREHRDPGR